MGTPTKRELMKLNPNMKTPNFPVIKCHVIEDMLAEREHEYLVDMLRKIFRYDYEERIIPYQAMTHKYFESLRVNYVDYCVLCFITQDLFDY